MIWMVKLAFSWFNISDPFPFLPGCVEKRSPPAPAK